MNKSIIKAVQLGLVIFTLTMFGACGQKGPLKIDQPPVELQTEESELVPTEETDKKSTTESDKASTDEAE